MKKLILLAATFASLVPAAAFADDTYVMTPLPAPDARIKFTPPSSAVFVIDQTTQKIMMCYPDNDKDNNYIVDCTATSDLPK